MTSLDLAARHVILASTLYYSADVSWMTDAAFDDTCKRLCRSWDKLDPFRQWQLGSEDDLWTSGYHIRVTCAGIGAANHILRPQGQQIVFPAEAAGSHEGARWWPCSAGRVERVPPKPKTPSAARQKASTGAGLLGSMDDDL
jgi:hypothetical protein